MEVSSFISDDSEDGAPELPAWTAGRMLESGCVGVGWVVGVLSMEGRYLPHQYFSLEGKSREM